MSGIWYSRAPVNLIDQGLYIFFHAFTKKYFSTKIRSLLQIFVYSSPVAGCFSLQDINTRNKLLRIITKANDNRWILNRSVQKSCWFLISLWFGAEKRSLIRMLSCWKLHHNFHCFFQSFWKFTCNWRGDLFSGLLSVESLTFYLVMERHSCDLKHEMDFLFQRNVS